MLVEQTHDSKNPMMPFYRKRPANLGPAPHPYGGAPFFRRSLFNGKAFDVVNGEIKPLNAISPDSADWTATGAVTTVEEIVKNYRS